MRTVLDDAYALFLRGFTVGDGVLKHHGWFADVLGPGRLYRVCAEDAIVEVVACELPEVTATSSEGGGT